MGSKVRAAAGVVIALFALAVAFGFPYSLLSEYGGFGSDAVADLTGYGVAAVMTAPFVGLGVWLAFKRGLWRW